MGWSFKPPAWVTHAQAQGDAALDSAQAQGDAALDSAQKERDRIAKAAKAERDRIAKAAKAERDRIASVNLEKAAKAERDRIARAAKAERDRAAREVVKQQELAQAQATAAEKNVRGVILNAQHEAGKATGLGDPNPHPFGKPHNPLTISYPDSNSDSKPYGTHTANGSPPSFASNPSDPAYYSLGRGMVSGKGTPGQNSKSGKRRSPTLMRRLMLGSRSTGKGAAASSSGNVSRVGLTIPV